MNTPKYPQLEIFVMQPLPYLSEGKSENLQNL